MNFEETGTLLGAMAAFDRRTVGEMDIKAWSLAMTKAGVRLPEALDAVAEHFSASRDWLMPIGVISRVKAARKALLAAAGDPPFPPNLSWQQEQDWRRAWLSAVQAGHADPQSVTDARFGIVRRNDPPIDPARLHRAVKELAASKGIAR